MYGGGDKLNLKGAWDQRVEGSFIPPEKGTHEDAKEKASLILKGFDGAY